MTNTAIPFRAPTTDAAIGRRVRNLLLDYGNIPASELARCTNIEPSGLSRRLSGKQSWDIDALAVVSLALNVSVLYLIGATPAPEPVGDIEKAGMRVLYPGVGQLAPRGQTSDYGGVVSRLDQHPRFVYAPPAA